MRVLAALGDFKVGIWDALGLTLECFLRSQTRVIEADERVLEIWFW